MMIEVTRLNGTTYWVNPHQIECIERNPDVTLVMLSGKKLVVKDEPANIIKKIIDYRCRLGITQSEL